MCPITFHSLNIVMFAVTSCVPNVWKPVAPVIVVCAVSVSLDANTVNIIIVGDVSSLVSANVIKA